MNEQIIQKNKLDKEKIGIMGGTFNPIHFGHLILSERAYEQFGLDKVLIMPTNNPPHKNSEVIAPDINRCAMIELAIYDNPHLELSLLEVNRHGITYTSDTLKELTEKYPEKEWYFILGGDSLCAIEKWREPQVIFDLATILVAIRDNYDNDMILKQIKVLKEKYGARIELLKTPNIEISSSEIRCRYENKLSCKYLVPKLVEGYVETHNLYRNSEL